MTKTVERILNDELTLDGSDRSDLIDELLVRSGPCTDPDYIAAWESEIGRRLFEINAGKSQPNPWKRAIEQIGMGEREIVNSPAEDPAVSVAATE